MRSQFDGGSTLIEPFSPLMRLAGWRRAFFGLGRGEDARVDLRGLKVELGDVNSALI